MSITGQAGRVDGIGTNEELNRPHGLAQDQDGNIHCRNKDLHKTCCRAPDV